MYVRGKNKGYPVNKLPLKVCSKLTGPEGLENPSFVSDNEPTPTPIRLENRRLDFSDRL